MRLYIVYTNPETALAFLMRASATIQQLRFELSAPNTPPARQLPERFSRLYHDKLAVILAEELSHYPPGGPPLQLAHLLVVVPPLAPDRLEQDLPQAFRTALRAALAALPKTAASSLPAAQPLASLAYFLLHGSLPWNANATNFDLNAALRDALAYQPAALRELLRRIGDSVSVRQRLARQLTDAMLGRLLVLLEPIHAPFIKDYIAQTLATHQRQALLSIPQTGLREIVYELVLADLLLRWHTSFTRQAFLERQIRGLAAHYNLLYEELLQRLAAMLMGRLAPTTLTASLQALQRQANSAASPLAPAVAGQNPEGSRESNDQPSPTAYMALIHYLRLGFLPHNWPPSYSLTDLSTQLALVLREGRTAVHQLAQAVGTEAAAYSFAHRFPLAISQQIVHLLAPGKIRAFLALLAELTTQADLPPAAKQGYEKSLWQAALSRLLSSEQSTRPLGSVRQWLPRHTGLGAAGYGSAETKVHILTMSLSGDSGQPAQTTNSAFFNYLLRGATVRAASPVGHLLALRQVLHQLLQRAAQPLLAFLRQHRDTAPVLRHLAAIADFGSLVELVMKARASRPWYLAGQTGMALAALLDNPSPTAAATPRLWLREAFLYFHLRPDGRQHSQSSLEAWSLLRGYNLPARAVHGWLLRRVAPPSRLAQSPFFAWLLGSPDMLRAWAHEYEELPSRQIGGSPIYSQAAQSATFLVSASRSELDVAGQLIPPLLAGPAAASRMKPDFIESRAQRKQARLVMLETQKNGRQQPKNRLPYSTGPGNQPVDYAGFNAGRLEALFGLPRFWPLPAMALPSTSFKASASWQPAGTRPAEAFELLLAHLVTGASIGSRTMRRAMFKVVLAQQPDALRAVLRRHGQAAGAMGQRLANIATFAELAILVLPPGGSAGRQTAARRALAALDALAGAEATQLSAGLIFLKAAFLAFHAPASGTVFSLRDAQRLAAVYRLPWRALLVQIDRLRQRVPALMATAFFARLWAAVPASQPARRVEMPAPSDYSRREQLVANRIFSAARGAARHANAPASELSGLQLTGVKTLTPAEAAREGLLYFLLHGQFPWWEPAAPSPAALRHTLAQTARQPLTQAFLKRHALEDPVRHRLAELSDFSLLHTLTAPTGPGRQQRQLLRPAFTRLDQVLRALPGGSQSRFHLFLREAYLTATLASASDDTQLAIIRKFAAAVGLSWRGILQRVGQLLRQIPALAADPFFALLLRQYQHTTASTRLPPRRAPSVTASPADLLKPASRPETPAGSQAVAAAALAADILEYYLRTGQLPVAHSGPRAVDLIKALLHAPDAGRRARLLPYLELVTARHRLAAILPTATEFLPLLRWLAPVAYQALAGIVRDWLRLQAAGLVQFGKTPADLWVAVLTLTPAKAPLSAQALATALVQALVRGESALAARPPASDSASRAEGSRRSAAGLVFASSGKPVPEALRLLRLIQRSQLRLFSYLAALLAAQLKPTENVAPVTPTPSLAAAPLPARPRPLMRPKPLPPELQPDTATYIANAGLVLVWPFLTMLFERLGYVAERQFRSIEQTTRAAYLLQFLATGEDEPPEHLLTLNKLLCGVGRALPLVRELPLTDAEKATGESLLGALMAQWGNAFKNTSIAGLRQTFLQRGGKLAWADDRVTLTVETKTVDILLDQRPWSIALIKLPWMPLPLYVTWR